MASYGWVTHSRCRGAQDQTHLEHDADSPKDGRRYRHRGGQTLTTVAGTVSGTPMYRTPYERGDRYGRDAPIRTAIAHLQRLLTCRFPQSVHYYPAVQN